MNGRNPARLHTAAIRLRQQGLSAEESLFDVTNEHEIAHSMLILDQVGGVDVLINNAGIQRRISLEKVDLATWNEVLQTNLTSAMLVSREVAKRMIQRRAGKIINVCSLMSELGRITTGPYTAANSRPTLGYTGRAGRFGSFLNPIEKDGLSSAASDFVNGQTIYVDGGMISVL